MNKIIEKNINYMFDQGIVSITERKNEEDILPPTTIFILTNGETIRFELPTHLTGHEQMLMITGCLKEIEKGTLVLPDIQKNKSLKVGVFLCFFEGWFSSDKSNIRPKYDPRRQTAMYVIAGDVDGYYQGLQTVNACNGQSVISEREILQIDLKDHREGTLMHILRDSDIKFQKMDDEAISKVIKEIP